MGSARLVPLLIVAACASAPQQRRVTLDSDGWRIVGNVVIPAAPRPAPARRASRIDPERFPRGLVRLG